MFRFILAQSKLYRRPKIFSNVLHLRGKKDIKQDESKQKQPVYKCPPKHYKILTMDDMQLPYGNWKEQYEKRNKSYNKVFLFGLVSLIGSIIVLKESVFFNAFPPPYPFTEEVRENIFECGDEDDKDCKCECECNECICR